MAYDAHRGSTMIHRKSIATCSARCPQLLTCVPGNVSNRYTSMALFIFHFKNSAEERLTITAGAYLAFGLSEARLLSGIFHEKILMIFLVFRANIVEEL